MVLMVAGVGGPGCWRCGVRRALIVVSVECWWVRSGCSMLKSCWVVRLSGGDWWVGGVLICTGCRWLDVVVCTRLGGDWLFTICVVGVVVFTVVTGRFWCCTVWTGVGWLFTELAE